MKTFKKLCAALLVVAMLMGVISVNVFAADDEDGTDTTTTIKLSDISSDTVVGNAVINLVKLGIINGYEDGTFRPDNTITRAEFAKIVTTFLNIDKLASDALMSNFPDVDDINHWAKAYIRLAADKKIVNGYEDGTFRPDAPVRYVEAVKMLVCALGYGEIAANRLVAGGEWYSGYMAVAAENGMLSSADVNNKEDYASRGVVAILTNNSLKIPVAQTSVGGKITIDSGKTALTELQRKEKVTGIVTGIYTTGLTSGSTGLIKRNILVDTIEKGVVEYQVAKNVDVQSLLGYKITGYSEAGSVGEAEQLSQIELAKNQNTTTVITDSMIDDFEGNTLYYYESESSVKRSSIKLDSKVSVIYNGKYTKNYDENDFLNVKSGKIKLVCNDGDGQAEVAFIESYENYVVSSVENKSARPIRINAKYGAPELLIPVDDNSSYYFTLTKVGSSEDDPVKLAESLTEWNVISVKRSKSDAEGKAVWEGIISTQKVSGRVTTEISDTETEIANKTYKIAYNYAEFSGTKTEFKVDNQVTVYLDANGYIAAATSTSTDSSMNVGYLINAEQKSGVSGAGWVSIYGLTGTTGQRTLKLASTVRIDGNTYKNVEDMLDALAASSLEINKDKGGKHGGEEFSLYDYSQMVRYTVNSSNEITVIDTILENTSKSADDLKASIVYPNPNNTRENKTYTYVGGGKFNDDKGFVFSATSSTKVLIVPFDVSDTTKYAIKTYTSAFSTSRTYRVEAYNVDEVKVAKYIICYTGSTAEVTFNDTSSIMIAKEIATVLDPKENEKIDQVIGYNFRDGASVTVKSEQEGFFLNSVQPGEIFWYIEEDDKVTDKKMILDIEDNAPVFYNYSGVSCLDPVAAPEDAKAKRVYKVDDEGRTDASSLNRFYFGTVNGMVSGANDVQLLLTNTLYTDECGVTEDYEETFTVSKNTSTAKVYLYDFSASKAENRIVAGASLDNIRSVMSLKDAAGSDDIDYSKASQVLIYQRSGVVRTVIIFKY